MDERVIERTRAGERSANCGAKKWVKSGSKWASEWPTGHCVNFMHVTWIQSWRISPSFHRFHRSSKRATGLLTGSAPHASISSNPCPSCFCSTSAFLLLLIKFLLFILEKGFINWAFSDVFIRKRRLSLHFMSLWFKITLWVGFLFALGLQEISFVSVPQFILRVCFRSIEKSLLEIDFI